MSTSSTPAEETMLPSPDPSDSIFEQLRVLLGAERNWQWLSLVLLAIFVSLVEAGNAALIYVLVGLLVSPDAPITLPLVGSISPFMGGGGSDPVARAVTFSALFFGLRGALYVLQSYLQNRTAHNTAVDLSKRLLHGYLSAPYSVYLQRNSAELIRNAHESTQSFAQQVVVPGIVLASDSLITFSICVVLFVTAPVIAAIGFALFGSLILVLLRLIQPRLLRLGRQAQDASKESLKSLQQILQGFRDVRLLGRERIFQDEFVATREKLSRAYYLRAVLVDVPRAALETTLFLVILIFIVLQVSSNRPLVESLGALGVFGYGTLRILPSVNRILNNVQSIRFARPLIDFLYDDVIAAEGYHPPQGSGAPLPLRDCIDVDNVSFAYVTADTETLSEITFSVKRGEKVGLVGRTGSGKSTLLDVLLGLLQPTSGKLTVDREDLRGLEASWWQSLSLVPQNIFLIDDSIKRNIALGLSDEDVSRADLEKAVQVAQLDGFVNALPDGLDAQVGERGIRLSGGQRQRIALARALYRKPTVLLLDEGTSALDSRTEADFIEALDAAHPELTLIIVTHRLASVQNCDRIIVLDSGRIVDSGTYQELISNSETFRSMITHFDTTHPS